MEKLITLLFLFTSISYSQINEYQRFWNYGNEYITDSVRWELKFVEYIGDTNCQHRWIEGEIISGINGLHIVYDSNPPMYNPDEKPRICKICLRKEILVERKYQRPYEKPKSEYDKYQGMLDSINNEIKDTLYIPYSDCDTISIKNITYWTVHSDTSLTNYNFNDYATKKELDSLLKNQRQPKYLTQEDFQKELDEYCKSDINKYSKIEMLKKINKMQVQIISLQDQIDLIVDMMDKFHKALR
jgi:hypothetical protein